jgi:nucleotide sugar dehydrogenase
MTKNLLLKIRVCSASDSISNVVKIMDKDTSQLNVHGIVAVIDEESKLLGVVSDGDIRRSIVNNIDPSSKVDLIMTRNPILIRVNNALDEYQSKVNQIVSQLRRENKKQIRYVFVVSEKNRLHDVIDIYSYLYRTKTSENRVVVLGLGFVGITLAVSLAGKGHNVLGVDVNLDLVNKLNKGQSHVYEPGLSESLCSNLKSKNISFNNEISQSYDIYIIAVGTPLKEDFLPNMDYLFSVLKAIMPFLKKGDQIVLRSTVPVGTTRNIVIPYIENNIDLVVGVDINISFCPERTVEGDAMNELKNLPQIIGGFTQRCSNRIGLFWSTLTKSVVYTSSLEAAELVKLSNNTFRDLSFAFANELAMLADKYNIDSREVINAANEGYPRDKIPFPSPGVGGYCLTKDPILFSCDHLGRREDALLGLSSREVNRKASLYPLKHIDRFLIRNNSKLRDMVVAVIGVAFKGDPETTDTRGSIAVDLFNEIKDKPKRIIGFDHVVGDKEILSLGFEVVNNVKEVVNQADILLFMNNHPLNTSFNSCISEVSKSRKLVFDGWGQFDRLEIERNTNIVYSSMGYITSKTGS